MIGAGLDRLNALFDRRFASRPSWVVLAELFLGAGWSRAAVAKLVDTDWWAGHTITNLLVVHRADTIGWYRPVVDAVIVDYRVSWALVVLVLEAAIGVSLLISVRVRIVLAAAIFLNVNFLLIGSPNPSIFYLMMQLGLVFWLFETSVRATVSIRWLRAMAIVGATLAFACIPYVRTLDPAAVIDDPASVLALAAFCTVVAAVVARRRVRRTLLGTVIELRTELDDSARVDGEGSSLR